MIFMDDERIAMFYNEVCRVSQKKLPRGHQMPKESSLLISYSLRGTTIGRF